MQSDNSDNSQERIRKATELLQKFWWFSFFLIIAPLIVAIIIFSIFNYARLSLFIALSLSVVSFIFALLFFYKAFDKYRTNPFFLNKKNNLTARIHILFLISVLSFVSTPIFILISPYDSFFHLPIISYAALYNIVYYYYYFQPIDFFNLSEEEFKHAGSFDLIVKQPYNFLVGINHIIHIIFLVYTAYTNFSWLFALITNLIFYFITLTWTKNQIKEINESIAKKRPVLKELTSFKRRIVVCIVSLIFFILIQMPFVITLLSPPGAPSLDLINSSFLTIIFILFYFKSRFYVDYYYGSKLSLYDKPEKIEKSEESSPLLSTKYQKYNSYLSGILILLITLFSFLIQIPLLILIILPFIYILLHYEQKYELCSKKYNKFVILLNSIAILIYISFGIILPRTETILLNFLAFCISLYVVLQIFVKLEYFIKENIIVIQNLLAVASFSLIIYSFFPIFIVQYSTFTSNPLLIFISHVLLHSLVLSVIFLISQYVLGVRYFYGKSPKLFRVVVLINSFLVEFFIFTFIFFRIYFLIELIPFLQGIIIASVLFPIFFMFFLFINYGLHVFPLKYFLTLTYFSLWIFIFDFFISLLIISLFTTYFIIIPLACIITSIFYYNILKFGLKLERVDESKFKKYAKINSYLLTVELFSLFSLLFFSAFQALSLFENIIYSTYLSLALVCGLINLFSKKDIFSEDLYIKLNTFILLYTSVIAFYYFLLLTLDTLYVFIIPLMVSNITVYIPILYLKKKKLYPKLISKSIRINSILLTTTISLIPTITGLELYFLVVYFDLIFLLMTVINFTLYILLLIFTISYQVLKKVSSDEKQANIYLKLQVLISFCIGITTIFYYSFFLLIGTLYYYIILPPIFTSCFLYIPLFLSYKRTIFNIEQIKRAIILNTIILTGLFTSIPVLIGLNLFWLGFVFNFYIFVLNILNSSIYIFYVFLLILINLSRKLKIKVKYILDFNRLKIIILFSISITTIFCYPFFLLINTLYGIFIPIISLLFSWFFLFYYSYKQEYFNLEFVKKLTIYNFIIFSCLIISLPTIIGLELTRIGLRANIILIITITSFLLFSFLKISEVISVKIKLKENYIKYFKLSGMISWFIFTVLLSYYIASIFIVELDFTPITSLILACCFFTFFILSIYTVELISNYFPDYSNVKYFQDIIIYGIILSVSFVFTFLGLSTGLFSFIFLLPTTLSTSFLIGFFLVVFILFLITCDKQLQLTQTKIVTKLVSWLTIKIIICISILSIIEFYGFPFSIINKILLFSLTFTFLTPLSLFILENLRFISSEKQILLKKITLIIFIVSLLSLYSEFLYSLIYVIPIFSFFPFIQITAIIANLFLFLYYYILRFNKIVEENSVFELYKLYFLSFLLFLSLLYFGSILSIFLILISYSIILSQRSIIPIFRFLSYFLLSYFTFLEIVVILSTNNIIAGFDIALTGIFLIIYLLSMSGVLTFSILLNIKKNNNLEKFYLYSVISLLSFVSLMTFTNILIIYNITISLFILLLFIGIFFYHQKDERYKWFIKPCVILFIFDLISFLSGFWLFSNQIFGMYNAILTFTLTLSITGFGFVLMYNDAPARFRKRSFYIVLISIVLSFPTFVYFLVIAALSMPLWSLIPLIVVIDFGVFLFYFSIGIYQWKISRAIWRSGWYAWNILPIVNWFIIYQNLTGIDIVTSSLRIGIFDVSGSIILSIIICSLFFLPVMYSKIKKYFSQIFFIIWGESLFLLYWISQNLFVTDILLRNLSFIMFSVTLLIPLLAIFKFWKIISIFWLFPLTFINATFLLFYLMSIGISLEITISIDILVIGLFLIVYSFFPNIRSVGIVLISAYMITTLGIFLTIYFILYSIILNPIFSLNISFIVIGFSLFSSKFVEIPKRIIDLCLSWILIFNFSWFTFNTISLFPNLIIFAFSLALTVFGCSFFIFNRYKMKISINKIIPSLIVAVGASSSITSLSFIIFNATPGILISTFSSVFIIFLYFIFIEYRYILWFLIPIPITTPILEHLLIFEVIQPFWLLTWAMLYLFSFQILINLFKNTVKEETPEIKNSLLKLYQDRNQLRGLNLTCFLLNSIFFSLFMAIIIPNLFLPLIFSHILLVYQISDFLIIWPFLFLFCMKYLEKSELNIKKKALLRYFSKISSVFYLLIPIALGINIFLYMIFINSSLVISLYVVLLVVSGLVFFEVSLIDRNILSFLFNSSRNKFTLWSWFVFSNVLSLFLFLFHLNYFLLVLTISLLGLISLHFLSYLDVSKPMISKGRLILIYNSFIWSSFYIASIISDGLILIFEELIGFTYNSLLFQNSSILLFILSVTFVKIEKNLKNRIEFILFIIFQGLFAVNLIYIFILYGYLNFFSINLVIFIEVCLSFISVYYFNIILAKQKYPNFLPKIHSILVLILYCEISIMIYDLLSRVIGIYESTIVSLSVLLILTSIDIYSVKKIKEGYARLIHTISFFTISVIAFLILYNYISQYPFFLGLGIFIFMIMQFYTNYSLFKSLEDLFPKGQVTLKKNQIIIQQLIGTGFYATICIFLVQILIWQRVELQLILLILSLLIHGLMIVDKFLLKFLGEFTNYIQVISWISIMTFTSTYSMWLYSTYFVAFFFTVIPIIVIILILELAYLINLLAFWKFVASNKEKIRFYLIITTYLNFITWPLYFASLNLFHIINLVLASFFIMFLITLIDNVLKEDFRKSLRSFSILIIGGLLSIDTFLLLDSIPNFNIFLNLSICSLIIHVLMIIDSYMLKFIGKFTNSIKIISWILIMTFTSTYLTWLYSTYFITFFFRIIPIIIIILILELAYLFKLLAFWKFVTSNKEKIRFNLIIATYLNFITWPLYFASLNPFHIFNLVLASFFIMFLITLIDNALKEDFRKSLRSYSFLIIGGLISIDLFFMFFFILGLNFYLTLSISSLVFVLFLGIKIKPFKGHSAGALVFWIAIFLLLSPIIYHVSLSFIITGIFFTFTVLIYPFVFLLEELRELINKIIEALTRIFTHLRILIKNMFIRIFIIFKRYFKFFWILISACIASFIGILFSEAILNFLNPIHATLLIFPIFGIIYSLKPSEKTEDVDIMFRRRMLRLVISWGSIIIIMFSFIPSDYYIFTTWISIWILGAILLPYIIFKEKNENISIKWRFYTLIILISMLILFGILLLVYSSI
ncbi:MAG: hypothetical protein V3V33_01005 [Candidatus Lokiarchaeia archaeon]